MEKTKVCSKCEKEFPLTDEYFEPRKISKDGFRNQCRICRQKQSQERVEKYLANPIVNETKVCKNCGKEYPATEEYFNKHLYFKDGLASRCKNCYKEYNEEHKEHRQSYQEDYYLNNKEKLKQYYENNKEHYLELGKKYREENKQYFVEHRKKWYKENPEYSKQYYQKNKYHILEMGKNYRKNNKELLSEKDKKRKEINREQLRECQKLWYEKNKELRSEQNKQWYQENKKHKNELNKIWKVANREKTRLYGQKREALKRQLPATLTLEQWEQIKKDFNYKCAYCGQELPLTVEHFIPLSHNGELSHNNILPVCLSCNCSKQDSNFFEWYYKYKFYSKKREKFILNYLHYTDNGEQQLTIAL